MNLRHVLVLLVAAAGLVAPAFSTTETDSGAAGTSGADVATGSSGTAGSTGAAAIVGTAGTEGATGGAEPCTGRINLSAVGTYNPHAVDPGDFTTHEVNAIAVDGTLAYVALNHNRIHAVDISDPTTPTLVDSLASPAFANRDVFLCNGVAFVGGKTATRSWRWTRPLLEAWQWMVPTRRGWHSQPTCCCAATAYTSSLPARLACTS